MSSPYIDKTILSLLSLLIAGAGILSILVKFSVPQLNMSFFGDNPFAVKRDIIEKVMTWIFVILACVGILIQAYVIIFEDELAAHIYLASTYIKIFIVGFLCIIFIVKALGVIGRFISKRIWLPELVRRLSEKYKQIERLLADGQDEECQKELAKIEELLELNSKLSNTKERYQQLRKYFN